MTNSTSMQTMTERTLEKIRSLDPGLAVAVERRKSHTLLSLPPARQADFRYLVRVYDDGEPYIDSMPLGTDADSDTSFWGWGFADDDYESVEERDLEFLRTLTRLLTTPSRIWQKSGLLWASFRCEVREQGVWDQVDCAPVVFSRPSRAPEIHGKEAFYESAPLILNPRGQSAQ